MWTDRQLEIIAEHEAELEKSGIPIGRTELVDLLIERANEERDVDPALAGELDAIIAFYLDPEPAPDHARIEAAARAAAERSPETLAGIREAQGIAESIAQRLGQLEGADPAWLEDVVERLHQVEAWVYGQDEEDGPARYQARNPYPQGSLAASQFAARQAAAQAAIKARGR